MDVDIFFFRRSFVISFCLTLVAVLVVGHVLVALSSIQNDHCMRLYIHCGDDDDDDDYALVSISTHCPTSMAYF